MADTRTPPSALAPPPPVPDRSPASDDRSFGDLLSELSHETTTLVKQEIRLAKAEAREEAREAGAAIGATVVGGAVAYTGLIALVIGLGWALGQFLDVDLIWLGLLIVGAVVALIGYFMLKKGLDALGRLSPPLDTTAQTLNEDKQWIKEQTP